MESFESRKIRRRIRFLLFVVILGLGFGCQMVWLVEPELEWMNRVLGEGSSLGQLFPALSGWIGHLHQGIIETYSRYPFIAYCMDWLAFTQLAYIVFFLGAIRDPVRNLWIIQSGMLICLIHLFIAFGCGTFRGIPLFWQLIDSSFGAAGFVILFIVYRNVIFLRNLRKH